MLDPETKRRIDNARDILVGKIPDPKSQVEQITIALIYKFMSDMDAEAERLGGKRSFFTGRFENYGWPSLMSPKLGGHDVLNLYSEAIQKMNENPGIPQLFRNIFKNAYLPYRDPETLRSFLAEINGFSYENSERLGDAFEYLLSVLGSQGDAGQFRTPRHIIDFMVEIIDPKKTETILDPACGTAGFLVSSYKHILKQNTNQNLGDKLSPDERKKLASNIFGYDISPDMVRLSLVNLYLHGFKNPQISEYDSLTSEDKWNDFADVILANPPFMTPKGGIKPHKRFSVESTRSEVLFVNYISEHLGPNGRAAIIVPDGIVFQLNNAYKQLRAQLIENQLVTIISLPSGVFNPYSAVKTSILILDKQLAKKTDQVLFIKIENDGYDLGTQRRENPNNNLPNAIKNFKSWQKSLQENRKFDPNHSSNLQFISKKQIKTNGNWNLREKSYENTQIINKTCTYINLKEISTEIKSGFACGKSSIDLIGLPHLRPMNITEKGQLTLEGTKFIPENYLNNIKDYQLKSGDVLFNNTNSKELVGKTCFIENSIHCGFSNHMTRIRVDENKCLPRFLAVVLHNYWQKGIFLSMSNKWIGQAGINTNVLSSLKVPLPPLAVQKKIVAEIEGYQKVIDGARQVVKNYKPQIVIDPNWPVAEMSKYVITASGGTPSKSDNKFWEGSIPWVSPKDMKSDIIEDTEDHISLEAVTQSSTKLVPEETLLCVVRSGILKHSLPLALTARPMCFNQDIIAFLPKNQELNSFYLSYVLGTQSQDILKNGIKSGVTVQSFHNGFFKNHLIPVPNLQTQLDIVEQVKNEQNLIAANQKLITIFEQKIQTTIKRICGEES